MSELYTFYNMKTSNKPVILHYLVCFALFYGGGNIDAQETNKCILSAFKPTITGHINNAFIKSTGARPDGKEKVIFWKKDLPECALVAAQGGTFLGGGGYQVGAQGEKIGLGETRIAIDGDTDWQFFGNLDYIDSTYTFIGTVRLLKHTFVSSENAPLVFKLRKDEGFVYQKGRGEVTTPDGKSATLGAAEPSLNAGDADATNTTWWKGEIPHSGFVPADENPDFDKYMTMGAPMRKGVNGGFVTDKVVAKGWDKILKSFYMTLQVTAENPIRVHIPEIPSTLPSKTITGSSELVPTHLHSDCKVLNVIDEKLFEATGRVGLAVSMPTINYIVGVPGTRLDLTAFTDKPLPLGGRNWRASSKERAFLIITTNMILLENVSEQK